MQNQLLAMSYDTINPAKAARLRACASEIAFSVSPSGTKQLVSANFCRVRLCPMCQWRRSLKVYGHTRRIMDAINADKPMAYLFATLTVRNCTGEELSDTIDAMYAAWDRLIHRKVVRQATQGYYRGLEITHNLYDNTYHPHLHVVFVVNPSYFSHRTYLSQSAWTDLWQQSLRVDYTPIVDVRRVKGNTAKAVAEAAKYTVKTGDYIIPDDWDLTLETVALLDAVLDRRRLVAYGGIMADWHKRLHLDDTEDGDLVHTYPDQPPVDPHAPLMSYYWHMGYRQYFRSED